MNTPLSPPSHPELMLPFIQAAQALEARLENALERVGLSTAKYGVLMQLVELGSTPLSELAARQSCVRSNMTQLIDRLESEGLVRRAADPSDRRIVRAEITPQGRQLAIAGQKEWSATECAFVRLLSDEEQMVLTGVLSKLR